MLQGQYVAMDSPLKLAALTKTSTPASEVRRIFYAKIWRKRYDVVRVKTRSFDIIEIDQNSQLSIVASRDDLDGTIVSSLVLPEAPHNGTSEDNPYADVRDDSEAPPGPYCLPPQLIVLTLQSDSERTLFFVFGYLDNAQKVQFGIRGYPLLSVGQNTMGTNMAVDPSGRLLAVAAQTGTVSLFKLKSWQKIKSDVEIVGGIDNEHFDAIEENTHIEIKGASIIWHIDFVPSPANERDSAFLVVVSENRNGRVLVVFKIPLAYPVKQLRPRHTINLASSSPPGLDKSLLFIPLKHHPGLILCTEKHFVLMLDIRSPEFELQPTYTNDRENEASSKSAHLPIPLYTNWCRRIHRGNWLLKPHEDTIYLCREDGQIRALRLTSEADRKPKLEVANLGQLDHHIDKAFAAVDLPLNEHLQSFITGGIHCNGVVASVLPRKQVHIRSVIPGVSPIIDFTAISEPIDCVTLRERIFATTNRGSKHGAISEIRNGYAFRLLDSIFFETEDLSRITCLPFKNAMYLLMFTLNSTVMVHQLDPASKDDGETQPGLRSPSMLTDRKDHDRFVESLQNRERIITVGLVRDGSYIIVTNKMIQKVSADWKESINLVSEDAEGDQILSAEIDYYHSQVLYVAAVSAAYELRLLQLESQSVQLLTSPSLQSEPSAICLYSSEEFSFTVVSTQQGDLEFYIVNETHLVRKQAYNLDPIDGICEDVVVLRHQRTDARNRTMSLLCGLRSGQLKLLNIRIEDQEFVISEKDTVSLGLTSVHIKINRTDRLASNSWIEKAVVYCDEKCYIYYDTGHGFTGSTLGRLWFVDSRNPTSGSVPGRGLNQTVILSLAMISAHDLPQELENDRQTKDSPKADDMFCLTRSGISRCRAVDGGKSINIPWQIPVGGHPVRTIWSTHHKRLISGLHIDLVIDPSPTARKRESKKITFGAIKILNPNSADSHLLSSRYQTHNSSDLPSIGSATDTSSFAAIVDPSGEQISALAEWQVAARGKRYHMLLVSTLERIRLYNFQAADGPLELKAVVPDQSKEPILSVAVYSSTSFVTLTYSSIVMYRLEERESTSKINFRQIARISLGPKRGSRSIIVNESQIIIGTQHHGIQIFDFKNDTFQHVFSDSAGGCVSDTIVLQSIPPSLTQTNAQPNMGKICISAYQPSNHNSLTTSSSSSTDPQTLITANYQPPVAPASGQLTTLFRFPLPDLTTRIRQTTSIPLSYSQSTSCPRILCSSLNGTFTTMTLLPIPLFKILKLLANLIEDECQTLCPFRYRISMHGNSSHYNRRARTRSKQPLIPTDETAEHTAVDGDLLMRLVRMHYDDHGSGMKAVEFVRCLIAQDYLDGYDYDGDGDDDGKSHAVHNEGMGDKKATGLASLFEDLLLQVVGRQGIEDAGGVAEACVGLVRKIVDSDF